MLGITEDIIDEVLREKTAHEQIVEALKKAMYKDDESYQLKDIAEGEKALTLLETHTVAPNEPTEEMILARDLHSGWCFPTEIMSYKAMIQIVRGKS